MVFSISKAAALLLVGSMGVEAASVAARIPEGNDRILRAATKRSAHSKRSLRIEKRFELELPYVEEPTRFNGHAIFASQLKVASSKPVLNLEDIEHHLSDVQCDNGKIMLRFVDTSSATDARLACHGPEGGIVVTSHVGCNPEGERTVYTVHGVSSAGDGSVLELSVKNSLFEHAFDRLEVGFGHTEEHHTIRKHTDLKIRKRQEAEMAEGAKNITEVMGSVPEDSDPNVHDAQFNLNWEVTNKTFRPDEFLAGLPVGFTLTNIANLPLELTCKKCLTRGEIILSQGNIQIDTAALKAIPDKIKEIPGMVASAVPSLINAIPGKMDDAGEKLESVAAPAVSAVTSIIDAVPSKIESIAAPAVSAVTSIIDAVPSKVESIVNQIPSIIPDIPDIDIPDINPFDRRSKMARRGVDFNLGKVVTGGFVELKANNLEAYFELGAKPKSTGYFTFRLLELPVLGFVIPGVARAGAIFEALLEADYEFDGGFDMTYGMNLVVPSNSTMRIDLGDMSKSGVQGFQDAKLTPLPFNFEQKQLDGFVSVAMVPSIPIGIKFLSVLDVGVEAEMDLPRLDALIYTIEDADTQCNDLGYEEEEEVVEGEEGEETTEEETTEEEITEEEPTEEETTEEEPTEEEPTEEETTEEETTEETTDEEAVSPDEAEFAAQDKADGLTAGKKRSVAKRDVKRASVTRRAPAAQKAQHARNLKRQAEAPFPLTNSSTSSQPDKLSLVYIEWNVSVAVNLGFNFVLPAMPAIIPGVDANALIPFKPIRKHKRVFTTVKAMPTLCLAPAEGFRPATDVYTDPVETEIGTIGVGTIGTGVGTIGTGVGTIGTGVASSGKPRFTDVPTKNATDFKLRRRQYGYGVDIPPYTPATPTPSSSFSTSTPCESTATPPPPPPPETTPIESSSTPIESSSEVPPPPAESTPTESSSSTESTSTPSETTSTEVPPPPPATTPIESSSSEVPPPPPATTPAESSSSEIPPPPESTPAESSSVPPPPTESTSTPCTTETPPPALPTSSPCTTSSTITVTLPYNTTTPSYQQPPGTASPPVPSKPSEFTGAAAMVMPTVGAVFFAFLAMLIL